MATSGSNLIGSPVASNPDIISINGITTTRQAWDKMPATQRSILGSPTWMVPPELQPSSSVVNAAMSTPPKTQINDPAIKSSIGGILNSAKSTFKPGASAVSTSTLNPNIAKRVDGAAQNVQADTTQGRQTLGDFARQILYSQPEANQNAQQESQAIARFYGNGPGSVQGDLNRLLEQDKIRGAQAVNNQMGQIRRQSNVARMNFGNSSDLDKYFGVMAGRLGLENSQRLGNQARDNLLYVLNNQTGLAGRRNSVVDSALNRMLSPVNAQMDFGNNSLSQLSQLNNMEDANTLYETPEQKMQRELSQINSLLALDRQQQQLAL